METINFVVQSMTLHTQLSFQVWLSWRLLQARVDGGEQWEQEDLDFDIVLLLQIIKPNIGIKISENQTIDIK